MERFLLTSGGLCGIIILYLYVLYDIFGKQKNVKIRERICMKINKRFTGRVCVAGGRQ